MAASTVPFPDKTDRLWVRGKLTAIGQSARKHPHERAQIVLAGFVGPILARRFPIPYQKNQESSVWYAYQVELLDSVYEVWIIHLEGIIWEPGTDEEAQYEFIIGGRVFTMTESSRSKARDLLQLMLYTLENAKKV